MTWFIFIGDLVVMAGLVAAAVWVFLRANPADLTAAARIPLDDDGDSATPAPAVIPAGKQETRCQGRQINGRVDAAFESRAASPPEKNDA